MEGKPTNGRVRYIQGLVTAPIPVSATPGTWALLRTHLNGGKILPPACRESLLLAINDVLGEWSGKADTEIATIKDDDTSVLTPDVFDALSDLTFTRKTVVGATHGR